MIRFGNRRYLVYDNHASKFTPKKSITVVDSSYQRSYLIECSGVEGVLIFISGLPLFPLRPAVSEPALLSADSQSLPSFDRSRNVDLLGGNAIDARSLSVTVFTVGDRDCCCLGWWSPKGLRRNSPDVRKNSCDARRTSLAFFADGWGRTLDDRGAGVEVRKSGFSLNVLAEGPPREKRCEDCRGVEGGSLGERVGGARAPFRMSNCSLDGAK